jgi:hypothetical protein
MLESIMGPVRIGLLYIVSGYDNILNLCLNINSIDSEELYSVVSVQITMPLQWVPQLLSLVYSVDSYSYFIVSFNDAYSWLW